MSTRAPRAQQAPDLLSVPVSVEGDITPQGDITAGAVAAERSYGLTGDQACFFFELGFVMLLARSSPALPPATVEAHVVRLETLARLLVGG